MRRPRVPERSEPSRRLTRSSAPHKLHHLAYGIERIGLIPLRAPVLSAIVLTMLCVFAAFGLARIKVDDSLSQLFRSDTPEFKQYEDVTQRFPSTEFDVLVVVEGKNLLERDRSRSSATSSPTCSWSTACAA